MNKRLKTLILALLIALISLSVAACNDNTQEDPGVNPAPEDPTVDQVTPINKSVVFENIKNGLVNAESAVSAMTEGTRNVTSEYSYMAGGVNVGIRYEANYAIGRDVDSEIMLLAHNYNTAEDVFFVYYDSQNLYYSIGGMRGRFESFRLNSAFDTFFDTITALDMQRVLYSEDFADDIESLSTMAESANITLVPTENTVNGAVVAGETITVRQINLDRIRNTVNDFLESVYQLAGTSLDALTDEFMGFKLSEMFSLQVGNFTATEFMTVNDVIDDNYINRGFDITFGGDQNNVITEDNDYSFTISYTRADDRQEFDIPSSVNPDNNNDYVPDNAGENYMTGILKLPFTDTEFTVDFRSYIDFENNAENLIAFNVYREKGAYDQNGNPTTERQIMFGIYMCNGIVYFDAEGLIDNYLRSHTVSSDGSVSYGDYLMDFEKLGLPKAMLGTEDEPIDLTGTINFVVQRAMSVISEGMDALLSGLTSSLPSEGGDDTGDDTETDTEEQIDWDTVFSKIESEIVEYDDQSYRYKDAYAFRVTIDSEFLEAVFGEDIGSLLSDYAVSMGFDKEIVEKIVGLGFFDELKLVVEYRKHIGELSLVLLNGDDPDPLFDLKLYVSEAGEEETDENGDLIIETPVDWPDELVKYDEFAMPETFGAEFTAEITFTEDTEISSFLGILVGDVTGANTAFKLLNGNRLALKGSLWEAGEALYGDLWIGYYDRAVSAEADPALVQLGRLTLTGDDPEYAYVVVTIPGVPEMRFRLSAESVYGSINVLTGEEFDYDSLIDIVYAVLGSSTLTLEGSSLGATLLSTESDTLLNDFFGAEFTASANVSFFFEENEFAFDEEDYPVPTVTILKEDGTELSENTVISFGSIYEARWLDRALVRIADKNFYMYINYTEESVALTDGRTEYHPVSLLMGANVGYVMRLYDADGGKLVNTPAEGYDFYWVIDPTEESPFPAEVPVIYKDGTRGSKPYSIKDDYGKDISISNETISQYLDGVEAAYYTLVIGEGSVAEQTFRINLEVLPGILVGYESNVNGIPIVASVEIDPLDYGAAIRQDPDYDPLRYDAEGSTSITLRFGGAGGLSREVTAENSELAWDISKMNVTFSEADWVFYGKYNGTVDIAVRVHVEPKTNPAIRITGEVLGEYTVDSLVTETYVIPTTTDTDNEVRIYFDSDHYRIVGNEADYLAMYGELPDDDFFDGFYEMNLNWSYGIATLTPLDGTAQPLDNGRTGTTTAEFGYAGSIGTQTITLSVNCPSREVGYRYDSVAYEVANREAGARINIASFTSVGDPETEVFSYNPYSDSVVLPSTVYINAVYREGGIERLIGYPVTWIAEEGVVTAEGEVTAREGEETYFVVIGRIGNADYEGAPTIELNMLIKNESGEYESLDFRGGTVTVNESGFVTDMNPYDLLTGIDENGEVFYRLPTEVELHFNTGSGDETAVYPTNWYFVRAVDPTHVYGTDYGAIDADLAESLQRIYADNFIVAPGGGSFVFATETAEGENILSQYIEITVSFESVRVISDIIYGLDDDFKIDTYAPESKTLLERMTASAANGYADRAGIGFDDTSKTAEVEVQWNAGETDAFIAALQSPEGKVLWLSAIVYQGTLLESEISCKFEILERKVTSLGFSNHNSDDSDLIALDDTYVNYMLIVEKVYALTADGAFATPYRYIEYLLSNIDFTVDDTPYKAQAEYSIDETAFNNAAYQRPNASYPGATTEGGIITVPLTVDNLYGVGSCKQTLTLKVVFHDNDIPPGEDILSEQLETFSEEGAPLYANGYTLPDESTITFAYKESAVSDNYINYQVTISGLEWLSNGSYSSDSGEELIHTGDSVSVIPSGLMSFDGGTSILLSTTLPDGFTTVGRQISVRPKIISGDGKNYRYNAASEVQNGFAVQSGYIEIPNIFAVYDLLNVKFAELLPKTIQPQTTADFTTDYSSISFAVTGWTPSDDFAAADGTTFDVAKLKTELNSEGYDGLLATSQIRGYNGEVQTVQLRVHVTALTSPMIVAEQLTDGGVDTETGKQKLILDPYGSYSNSDGKFSLPQRPTLSFNGGAVVHKFTVDLKYAYTTNPGNQIFDISYSAYANLTKTLTVTLPDGTKFDFDIAFIERLLGENPRIEYTTTANAGTQSAIFVGKYYIDPYDSSTYALPTTADFYFGDGITPLTNYSTGTWSLKEGASGIFASGKYLGGLNPGVYTFSSALPQRGSSSGQAFTLKVYVLDRVYTGAKRFDFVFDGNDGTEDPETADPDPFTALVTDLVAEFTIEDTETDAYADYFSAGLQPVTPDVLWYKNSVAAANLLSDSDLKVFGGYTINLVGVVGYGTGSARSSGQQISGSVSAPSISFDTIGRVGPDGNFVMSGSDNIFAFNPFTFECMESEFYVRFLNKNKSTETTRSYIFVRFTEEGSIEEGATGKAVAAVIEWDDQWYEDIQGSEESSQQVYSVTLTNRNKDTSASFTPEVAYKYVTRQISIDELDLGYGQAGTQELQLVIDPMNPIIPERAEAFGSVQGTSGSGDDELRSVGEVAITWLPMDDGTLITDCPLGGGTRMFTMQVVTTGGYVTQDAVFTVNVTYLNRVPTAFSTESGNYSSAQQTGGYYPLMITDGGSRKYYFTLDPTNQNLFTTDATKVNTFYLSVDNSTYLNSMYLLPDSIRVQFANDYAEGSIAEIGALKLGTEIELYDIDWLIVRDCDSDTPDRYRDINLAGTDVLGGITAKPRRFRIKYYSEDTDGNVTECLAGPFDYFTDDSLLGINYELQLETPDRQIRATSISSAFSTAEGLFYQRAFDEYYIDPYDISFPSTITVTFGTGTGAYDRTYTDVVWTYDESYMEDPSVVTGLEDGNPLPDDSILHRVEAFMSVYGTTLMVSFPVRHRHIAETTVDTGEGETTVPMSGGTIYVLQGVPLAEQLPDKLYYEFEYTNGNEIAGVPLQFTSSTVDQLSTDVAGTVHSNVEGQLGINKGNIRFTIIVVDPKLYSTELEGDGVYYDGAFEYDSIPVAVTINGAYLPGPEQQILPDKIIIGDGVYWDIDSIEYVTSADNPHAVIHCSYRFTSSTDNDRLYGDINGSDRLTIQFEVPLRTYVYTSVQDSSAVLRNVSYMDGIPYIEIPLGSRLTADMLPKASGREIYPLWDTTGVNQNLAGTYYAEYSYLNVYNETLTGSLMIIIGKREFTSEQFEFVPIIGEDTIDFLNHEYMDEELNIEDYVEISETFLRSDGSLGYPEGYSVTYSINGGITWQTSQPINVGKYLVRITMEDYNYTGYLTFEKVITARNVYVEDNIYYVDPDGIDMNNRWEYVYDGEGHAPSVAGVPEGLSRQIMFADYVPSLSDAGHDFSSQTMPRAAGEYLMRVTFDEEQTNYNVIGNTSVFYVRIRINPATIDETTVWIVEELEYNGTERDAVISGLPAGVASVVYYYTDSNGNPLTGGKPRNVGTYNVSVTINGGNNYSDYYMSGTFTIVPREIIISIGRIRSEYLSEIQPYDSALRILYAGDQSLPGLVGDELAKVNAPEGSPVGYVGTAFSTIFPGIGIMPMIGGVAGEMNSLFMVDEYELDMVGEWTDDNYRHTFTEEIGADGRSYHGIYEIAAVLQGSLVISDADMLQDFVGRLTDGATARWYLMPGDYGSVTIGAKANISIIGSYEFVDGEPEIAVNFDKIVINGGTVLLDILSFNPAANTDNVYVGKDATVTVSRSEFVYEGQQKLSGSTAIHAADGSKTALTISEVTVIGYSSAVSVDSGNVSVSDSEFGSNITAITSLKGAVSVSDTEFVSNSMALRIGVSDTTPVLSGCVFRSNETAIETFVPLRNDYAAQNKFIGNTVTVSEKF